MTIHSAAGLSAIVDSRVKGYALPAEAYISEAVYEADVDVFFTKHWIVAGVDADVAEPGDVLTLEIGKNSVLITRDDDGNLQAFHNVCRHRGAKLVSEHKTNVAKLVCPYHQWTYDLDGSLVHAPSMGEGFDQKCHSLRAIQVRSVGGIIMLCIDGNGPEDIEDLVATMAPRLEPFDLSNAKIAVEKTIIEEGNWKLSIDNNRECYHCGSNHPEVMIFFHPLDLTCEIEAISGNELKEWNDHKASTEEKIKQWEAAGYPSELVEEMENRATLFRTHRFNIAGEGESHTLDTKRACNLALGKVTDFKLGDLHYWTHNSWHHIFADHAVISYLIPLAPDKTELRSVWLVHKDAVEGVDYDVSRLTAVWEATNQQDADLVKITQQGVSSTGYVPGPLSKSLERLVELNMQWYIDRLKVHGYGAV